MKENKFKMFAMANQELLKENESNHMMRGFINWKIDKKFMNFYLPEGKNSIFIEENSGTVKWKNTPELFNLKLPYRYTCILTEETFKEGKVSFIYYFSNLKDAEWLPYDGNDIDENSIVGVCMGRIDDNEFKIFPLASIGRIEEDGRALIRYMSLDKDEYKTEENNHMFSANMFLCCQSLLGILNLNNVKKQKVEPSKSTIKRFRKQNKKLYDYHVLNVGGEVWNKPNAEHNKGSSKRSHYRRGHIRQLKNGERTWVNNCYVHGKQEGFVDKNYRII